jgi:tRNA(Ser,Leu) C12 N-acetylase TAN1
VNAIAGAGDGASDDSVHTAEDYGITASEQRRREPLAARLAREIPDAAASRAPHAIAQPVARPAPAWNVVVVAREKHFQEARHLLGRFGSVARTRFYNIITMRVADPCRLLDELGRAFATEERTRNMLSRVLPLQQTFGFRTLHEFERAVAAIAAGWVDELADSTFHVRLHQRGGDVRMDATDEVAFVGEIILQALEGEGATARVTFDDPDLVIDIELLDDEGGMSLWTRDDLRDYPFLRPG